MFTNLEKLPEEYQSKILEMQAEVNRMRHFGNPYTVTMVLAPDFRPSVIEQSDRPIKPYKVHFKKTDKSDEYVFDCLEIS
jgi:hypothetical protein